MSGTTGASRPRQLLLIAAALAACTVLGSLAVPVNLKLACHWKQWPLLPGCTRPAEQTVAEQIQTLKNHLARNPGDALAYADLVRFSTQPRDILGLEGMDVLKAAGATAPNNGVVLRLQAAQALEVMDWASAVSRLAQLSTLHSDANARTTLALLVGQSPAFPALLDALVSAAQDDPAWVEQAIRAMPAAQISVTSATPLVGRLAQTNSLSSTLGQLLIKQLKAEGAWVDAHAIWLHLWKRPLGLLFNGDFERSFISGAFDWEISDTDFYRAGAQAGLVTRAGNGQVLQVKLTGRLIKTPIVRQDLMLPPGQYRLSGEYQSTDLQSDQGLAWVFSCDNGRRELARSPGLLSAGHNWVPFSIRFQVPEACGPSVVLALQTQAPYEAKTGQRGEMLFDRFDLTRE